MSNRVGQVARILGVAAVLLLAACGGGGSASSGDGSTSGSNGGNGTGGSGGIGGGGTGTGGGTDTAACTTPLAPTAVDRSIVVNVPSDFDSTALPTPTQTTTISFTVLLPTRCAGDRFPLILQSHGYGGTRLRSVGADGSLHPEMAHFASINALVQSLPFHGYVVISFDERGHGAPLGTLAPHNARIIDPRAEVADARAILDWAYDNAAGNFIQTEPDSGIAKDLRLGTIGYSYGGGFQMPLSALDARVDAIVPNGTWNNLLYSLLPGDGVKLGFDGLLCVLALQGNVNNTPLVASLCNLVGPAGLTASTLRTRMDLGAAATSPLALPRPAVNEAELLDLFFTHSARYFEVQQDADQPWGFGEQQAQLRPVPALFLQGNRDVLFNLTDAYFNYAYYAKAGGDVRLLSTEGGHMNPLLQQMEGSANCGGVVGVNAVLAWFDQKLKGQGSATYDAIPKVCISVADTPAAGATPANAALVGVKLDSFPVGSLSGTGSVPASVPTMTVSVPAGLGTPVFAPVVTIAPSAAGAVLAGVPRVQRLSVSPPALGSLQTAVAYVGIGIQRGTQTILVDDEVTPFADVAPSAYEGGGTSHEHTNNRGVRNHSILLPAVGERLQVGDVVGLLFYERQGQYLAVNAGGQLGLPNPYDVSLSGVELPILIPGTYPGSSLSTP